MTWMGMCSCIITNEMELNDRFTLNLGQSPTKRK